MPYLRSDARKKSELYDNVLGGDVLEYQNEIDIDHLKELITDKKESLKAISIFKKPSDYPEKLKNFNKEQLEKDIKLLEIEKNDIENEISMLLKKNA